MSDDPPIPAATLVVMRPAEGKPEILVVERAAGMAFAGGAIVFPGGRIDEADRVLAAALDSPEDAAKVTAIRETIEESAIVAGVSGTESPAIGPLLQAALLGGSLLADVLDEHRLTLDLDALTPFARWMPAFKQPRRFDTVFFLAPAPPGDWLPVPQPGECQAAEWATASDLLDRIAAGDARAIFPTKRNLERLARFASIAEALADAGRYPLDTIVPWIERRGGEDFVCIPEDRGYPLTAEPVTTALRA
ncbi:MAG: NUDIX domain-containing protein [Pseudomonadota bacterium]|nr:NUDIX domain-containing protein [Pseudomonadota bacterium]